MAPDMEKTQTKDLWTMGYFSFFTWDKLRNQQHKPVSQLFPCQTTLAQWGSKNLRPKKMLQHVTTSIRPSRTHCTQLWLIEALLHMCSPSSWWLYSQRNRFGEHAMNIIEHQQKKQYSETIRHKRYIPTSLNILIWHHPSNTILWT